MKPTFNDQIIGRGYGSQGFMIIQMMIICSIPGVEHFLAVWTSELAFIFNQMVAPISNYVLVATLDVQVYYPIIFQNFLATHTAFMELTFNYRVSCW